MSSLLRCPICQQPLKKYQTTQDLACDNKHQFPWLTSEKEQGYYSFAKQKQSLQLSRHLMRARRFLLQSPAFQPLLELLNAQLKSLQSQGLLPDSAKVLDANCGDGLWLKQIQQLAPQAELYGLDEAENNIFAASKELTNAWLAQAPIKGVPFVDQAFDAIFYFDKPLKGKELTRVLAEQGVLIHLYATPKNLAVVQQAMGRKVLDKELQLNLPKEFELLESQRLSWSAKFTSEQILTLVEMSSWGWRLHDKQKKLLQKQEFAEIELDYQLVIARKRGM